MTEDEFSQQADQTAAELEQAAADLADIRQYLTQEG